MGKAKISDDEPKKPQGDKGKKQEIDLTNLPDRRAGENFLADIFGTRRRNPVDRAQEVMYQAWEAPSKKKRVSLAQKALEISLNCADAYCLLAEETAKGPQQAIDLYQKGVQAGERALGKKAFKEYEGSFWGFLETRPYMRARAGLADCLWEIGKREESVEHYRDMLRLNPNDNQGIRYLLMTCLIELGRDLEAEVLFKHYKNDGMAAWVYSRALLDFRKLGDNRKSQKSLVAAIKDNPHIPALLLGLTKMPRYLPPYYGWGDENEAILYVHENLRAWKGTPGALEWLATRVK
jgi:tetratricopeptide (TPR) repeat protein